METYKNPMFKAPDRRYKLMKVSPELLLVNLFNNSVSKDLSDGNVLIRTVSHDIPEGTQIEAVTFDDYSRCFMFRLWRADWPEIAEASVIPDLDVTFTSRDFTLTPEASEMWKAYPSFWLEIGEGFVKANLKAFGYKYPTLSQGEEVKAPTEKREAVGGYKVPDEIVPAMNELVPNVAYVRHPGDIAKISEHSGPEAERKINFKEFL